MERGEEERSGNIREKKKGGGRSTGSIMGESGEGNRPFSYLKERGEHIIPDRSVAERKRRGGKGLTEGSDERKGSRVPEERDGSLDLEVKKKENGEEKFCCQEEREGIPPHRRKKEKRKEWWYKRPHGKKGNGASHQPREKKKGISWFGELCSSEQEDSVRKGFISLKKKEGERNESYGEGKLKRFSNGKGQNDGGKIPPWRGRASYNARRTGRL